MDDQKLFKTLQQQKMYQLAFALSVGALFSIVVLPVFLPAALGSIALIFNELARGASDLPAPAARKTAIMSTIAIVIGVGLMVFVIISFIVVLNDPELFKQASELMNQRYGYTLEEFLQSWGFRP